MGCCANRSKFDGSSGFNEDQIKLLNQLPTYDNILSVYNELDLPKNFDRCLMHKKEKLLFMIINLLRVRPRIFMQQMNNFKVKCHQRQKPKNLIFVADDVQTTIEFLSDTKPTHPLQLSLDLCDMCRTNKSKTALATQMSKYRANRQLEDSLGGGSGGTKSRNGQLKQSNSHQQVDSTQATTETYNHQYSSHQSGGLNQRSSSSHSQSSKNLKSNTKKLVRTNAGRRDSHQITSANSFSGDQLLNISRNNVGNVLQQENFNQSMMRGINEHHSRSFDKFHSDELNPQDVSSQERPDRLSKQQLDQHNHIYNQKLQMPKPSQPKLSGVKEMVIDFICREDLVLTTLKEFFEIFISSIKKEQVFHSELLNPAYSSIGLSLTFNSSSSIATLKIFLAKSVVSQNDNQHSNKIKQNQIDPL